MGTVMEAIAKRYSVRGYQDKSVEREKILQIVEAACLAPSTSNVQPWRFVVVEDPRLKDALVERGMGIAVPNRWAKEAPVIIVKSWGWAPAGSAGLEQRPLRRSSTSPRGGKSPHC